MSLKLLTTRSRRTALGMALGAIAVTTACHTTVARPGLSPPPEGSKISIKYRSATDVRAITAGGDTVTLPRMQSIAGRLLAVRGDTLIVQLDRWPEGYQGSGPAPRAIVHRTPDVLLEKSQFSVARTAGVAGITAAVIVVALGIALVAALSSGGLGGAY